MNKAIERVIQVAVKENGVREIGNTNRGRKVDEYQRADLLPGVGYAWCASFSAWSILTALGEALCDTVWLRSASCDFILDWARRRGIVTSIPTIGSAGLVMASKNDATHIFLVTKVNKSSVNTVEGNTNDSGSRNGNGVYIRTRTLSSKYLYVNWARLLPATYDLPDGTFEVVGRPQPINPLATAQKWDLLLGGKFADKVPLFDGQAYAPAWKWAHWFNQDLGWNPATQTVSLNDENVPAQVRLLADEKGERRAWVPVTALATVTNLKVTPASGKVLVAR